MHPEQVTTSQFFGSFTANHWRLTIGAIFISISIIVSGSYWVGQKMTETQSLAQQAELRGAIAQLQAKLDVSQSHKDMLISENLQWRGGYQKLQEIIAHKNDEVSQLSRLLGRANNCTFIHERIRATLFEIDNSKQAIFSLNSSNEWEEKQKTDRAILEKRLEGFQQQLASCSK